MPIETLDHHDLKTFLGKLRMLDDCIDRAGVHVSQERWNNGKLEYVIEQLGKARKYLMHAEAVAVAQQISVIEPTKKVIGFVEDNPCVQAEEKPARTEGRRPTH
jgi:hypothetical protein